jgi:acyl dehydratase
MSERQTPVGGFVDAWVRSGRHLSNSVGHLCRGMVAANRAVVPAGDDGAAGREPAATPAVAYSRSEWAAECDDDGTVAVGDVVRFSKRLTEEDVDAFADASGDTNRLHLDDEFADGTRFGRRIAHGTLVSGLISAALARLPGVTIYLSQDLQFLGPVGVDETVTAVCEVIEDLGDRRYRLTTVVENEAGETVIDGEAVVLIDDPPAAD